MRVYLLFYELHACIFECYSVVFYLLQDSMKEIEHILAHCWIIENIKEIINSSCMEGLEVDSIKDEWLMREGLRFMEMLHAVLIAVCVCISTKQKFSNR